MTPASRSTSGPSDDAGFALVAALVAAVLFAFFAYTVLAADRGATAEIDGRLRRARLEAAADAALATAIAKLGGPENTRWPINRRPQSLSIDGMEISAVIEDERGKVPLNRIKLDQTRRLLQAAGVSGARLDQLSDSLTDWIDSGVRPNGAKTLDYAAENILPRNGPVRTLDELMAVKGMDADLLQRISVALTLFPDDSGAFEIGAASPLAIKAMSPTGGDSPDAIVSAREQAGERPKLAAGPATSYVGRPLTVRLEVRAPDGGTLSRTSIIEFTGQKNQPVWIRSMVE